MAAEKAVIAEEGGGWVYRLGGRSFGSYPSREAALIAAEKHGASPRPDEGDGDAPAGAIAPGRLTTETDDGAS